MGLFNVVVINVALFNVGVINVGVINGTLSIFSDACGRPFLMFFSILIIWQMWQILLIVTLLIRNFVDNINKY